MHNTNNNRTFLTGFDVPELDGAVVAACDDEL